MRPDFFIPILSCFMTAMNYEITYISHTETSLVMLKLYFCHYLSLLVGLLIRQQIHPSLLKYKGTLELHNCHPSKQVVEYKKPLSIDYIYYCTSFSLHFNLH